MQKCFSFASIGSIFCIIYDVTEMDISTKPGGFPGKVGKYRFGTCPFYNMAYLLSS